MLLQTADLLRKETGLVRQLVYKERHQQVLALIGDHLPAGSPDVDQVIADVIGQVDGATRAAL
jgi:hypothetical protein